MRATFHLLISVGLLAALACSERSSAPSAPAANTARGEQVDPAASAPEPSAFAWPEGRHRVAVLEVESLGSIHVELYPELAPENVVLFEKLTDLAYYDGTTFHRVVPGFMIQGGDPNTKDAKPKNDGTGSSGMRVPDEFGDVPPVRGAVGMANRGKPNTGSGQFFIVHQDSPHLAGRYSFFGRVVQGIEVVDRVTAVERDVTGRWGPKDRPIENVVVMSVELSTAEDLARND